MSRELGKSNATRHEGASTIREPWGHMRGSFTALVHTRGHVGYVGLLAQRVVERCGVFLNSI